ncbi:hypothetical protein GCM10007100_30670 [Roseibacillus persicicus]|uniref:Uncharacterized protein n=2 Tax=Roseibacillus persicicus TaxID=454148 RepID=A0A918TT16_9BACT|nr:hypothetical protein GCM10007100_30670 [Roseibacillus persicicus]
MTSGFTAAVDHPWGEWKVKLTRQTMKKTIALGAISAMAFTGLAYSEIDTSFHVGYNSTYVWRGQDLGDSMYEYGLDVSGSCDCGFDWNAGIWYANPSDGDFNDELDIYGSISKDFGAATVSLGFIHYEFDETDADNSEIFLGLGTSVSGFDLGATLYYGVDGSAGTNPLWGELTAGYGYDFSDMISGSLGLTVGALLDSDTAGDPDYTWFTIKAGLDIAASEDITVSPYIAYNTNDDDGFLGSALDFDGIYGGVTVSFAF